MLFHTFGDKNRPVLVMLTGSFCPGESMENLYSKLQEEFYIIVPTYNGHYEESKDFTTRQGEASEIKQYIKENEIDTIQMIYGQSMGSEVGIELLRQLLDEGIDVETTLFDGAPCIVLSKAYKAFMYWKFKTMISMLNGKTLDEAMNIPIIKKFSNGDPEALKPMIEPLIQVAPFITKASIKNEVECCYTFDFPTISEEMQQRMYFFYGEEEKAYKTCFKGVKKAYPKANYRVESGYGHLTYACKNIEMYVEWMKEICKDRKNSLRSDYNDQSSQK